MTSKVAGRNEPKRRWWRCINYHDDGETVFPSFLAEPASDGYVRHRDDRSLGFILSVGGIEWVSDTKVKIMWIKNGGEEGMEGRFATVELQDGEWVVIKEECGWIP